MTATVDTRAQTAAELDQAAAHDTVELVGSFGVRRVRWYSSAHIGSAAFWLDQARRSKFPTSYRLGGNLTEEVAACVLGGHGITGAMTMAAFEALRERGLVNVGARPTAAQIEAVLRQPLTVPGYGNPMRYRFAAQRSRRLADALRVLNDRPPPPDLLPREFRDWLTQLSGVGPKTASWVVRNMTESDDIAIIDIHVHRAGLVAGVFDQTWRLPQDYQLFEDAFCAWAAAGRTRTADLDVCIWNQLATAARYGFSRLDRVSH